jgi:hypothetical protein
MPQRVLLPALVALLLALPGTGRAQVVVFGGAGPTIPIGDFGDDAKVGGMIGGGLVFPLGSAGLGIFGEGFFGVNTYKSTGGVGTHDAKSHLSGFMGGFINRFGNPEKPGLYAFLGAGLVVNRFRPLQAPYETDSGFGYGGGIGLDVPAGSVSWYVEARCTGTQDIAYCPIMTGVSVPLQRR